MNEQTNDLTESCINKFHELANLFKEKNICMKQLKAIA